MEFDLEDPLTSLKHQLSDTIPALFSLESDHMPSQTYVQCLKASDFHFNFRQEAIALIFQAQYACNFSPFTSYLAVNYMDRFVSRQEIPDEKPWILRLLAISCLTLASKMTEMPFSPSNFQIEEGFIFNAQTIHRMELLILDALNWRMRSITPFSFVCFFVSLFELKEPPFTQALKDRAIDIIFNAQNEIKFLEFKPSTIAAAALLLSSHEIFPLQYPSFKASVLSHEYAHKENLLKCYNTMQEMVINEGASHSVSDTLPITRTPQSVLDCDCSKTESEGTTSTTTATELAEMREVKRRRMNGFCRESERVQISQIHYF